MINTADEIIVELINFSHLIEDWFRRNSQFNDFQLISNDILNHPKITKTKKSINTPTPRQKLFNKLFIKFFNDDEADPSIVRETLYESPAFPYFSQNMRQARIDFKIWKVSDLKSKPQFKWWDRNNTAEDIDPTEHEVY